MSKTVLITGATSGFGLAAAHRFGAAGWNLILTGRREERLNALKAELQQHSKVLTLTLDVRDTDAIIAALTNLPAPFDDVHTLINNAGLALGTGPAQEASRLTGTP